MNDILDVNYINIGQEYTMVRTWLKLWKEEPDANFISLGHNNLLLNKYPNFKTDTDLNNHNFLTDGKIFSEEKIIVFDIEPVVSHVSYNMDDVEFKKQMFRTEYKLSYKKHGSDKIFKIIISDNITQFGVFDDINTYTVHFINHTNASLYKNDFEEQILDKIVDGQNKINANWMIHLEKAKNSSTIKPNCVKISTITWTTEPVHSTKKILMTLKKRFAGIIPAGYRMPTKEDWLALQPYFYSYNKYKGCYFIDPTTDNKLILPIMGYLSNSGDRWYDKKFSYYWMDFRDVSINQPYGEVMKLTTTGEMTFETVNIEPEFAALLFLIKEFDI